MPPPPKMIGLIHVLEPSVWRPSDGTVVSIGSEVKDLSLGDRVFFQWQHGGSQRFGHEGRDYYLLNNKQILAIIE